MNSMNNDLFAGNPQMYEKNTIGQPNEGNWFKRNYESLKGTLFGKPEALQQAQKYTPQQQMVQNQLLQGGSNQLPQTFEFLQKILSQDPELMQQFQAPAIRQFNEQTIPGIAERFSAMGGQKSNAFGQQLGQAGASLQENLSAQRANLGLDAIKQLQQLLSGGLTERYENIYRPETSGLLGTAAEGIAGGAGQATGMAAMAKLLPMLGLL